MWVFWHHVHVYHTSTEEPLWVGRDELQPADTRVLAMMEEAWSSEQSVSSGSSCWWSPHARKSASLGHCLGRAMMKEDYEGHVGRRAAEREVHRTVYLQTRSDRSSTYFITFNHSRYTERSSFCYHWLSELARDFCLYRLYRP